VTFLKERTVHTKTNLGFVDYSTAQILKSLTIYPCHMIGPSQVMGIDDVMGLVYAMCLGHVVVLGNVSTFGTPRKKNQNNFNAH